MQRLLVVFTGGTIASKAKLDGKGPDSETVEALREHIEGFFEGRNVEILFRYPWGVPGLDSSNLNPGHWVQLASLIADEIKRGISGVLILHGTDTMAYSSSWLSLCFPNVRIPIIITGSQLTLDYMPEDATVNLKGAASVACSDVFGVWIYCNWKLIPGNRAHKAQATHPDAYVATNGQPLYFNPEWARKGHVFSQNMGISTISPLSERVFNCSFDEALSMSSRINWLFCAPGFCPHIRGDEAILPILGYGSGNAPSSLLNSIKSYEWSENKPHIIACSQAEGDIKSPGSYADVGIASLAQEGFTVWSQMDYPIEFIHSLSCYSLMASLEAPGFVLSHYLRQF